MQKIIYTHVLVSYYIRHQTKVIKEEHFLQGFWVALILVLVAMQNDAHFPK